MNVSLWLSNRLELRRSTEARVNALKNNHSSFFLLINLTLQLSSVHLFCCRCDCDLQTLIRNNIHLFNTHTHMMMRARNSPCFNHCFGSFQWRVGAWQKKRCRGAVSDVFPEVTRKEMEHRLSRNWSRTLQISRLLLKQLGDRIPR